LGRTGAQVSAYCLGCMNFGSGADERESIAMVDRAMDAGINFLDTANVYGRGTSETIVGKALARDGRRDKVFLATKVHGKMSDDGVNDWGNQRFHIMRSVEESLKRLQTDHIDLYQIHRPQSGIPVDEMLRALDDLVTQGKVRYIGTSTFAAWQLVEALWAAETLVLNRFVSEQPPYHILDRRIERELVPFAQTYGVGLIPWSPLAGGLLTGKYSKDGGPKGSRYESGKFRDGKEIPEAAWNAIEGVRALAEEKGVAMDQFALAWCATQPGITSPIIGPRTMDQLEDNLKAVDVTVTDEDRKRVDALVPPGTHVVEYYNADFGPNARWR
jgi:aryl-alcohol dehydrogenase-like predicted oxidoreductase